MPKQLQLCLSRPLFDYVPQSRPLFRGKQEIAASRQLYLSEWANLLIQNDPAKTQKLPLMVAEEWPIKLVSQLWNSVELGLADIIERGCCELRGRNLVTDAEEIIDLPKLKIGPANIDAFGNVIETGSWLADGTAWDGVYLKLTPNVVYVGKLPDWLKNAKLRSQISLTKIFASSTVMVSFAIEGPHEIEQLSISEAIPQASGVGFLQLSRPSLKSESRLLTIKDETACKNWLVKLMQSHPNKPVAKNKIKSKCFPELGSKAFLRAWSNAIHEAGVAGATWASPGIKRYRYEELIDTPPIDTPI